MKARIFLGGLFHETNTFVEQLTGVEDFKITRDEELLSTLGDGSPMDGFLSTAATHNWEIVPGVDYRATPSGPLADDVFERYWGELRPRLEKALEERLDAIFLVLHGAMATESFRDVEGELMERIRALPGAAALPLVAVLDLHANVSERMARHASALVPYRENPHTDARETAVRATEILGRILADGVQPHIYYRHSRLLLTPPDTATAEPLMGSLEAMARSFESSAGHHEVGVAAGFAHSDTPDTGMSFWVVSDQPEDVCREALDALCAEAGAQARSLRSTAWEVSDALDVIEKERRFPALLVEPSDNIGGGAPGDATFLLRAMMERPIGKCAVALNDPDAVKALGDCSPGQTRRLSIGGKGSSMDLGPVELEVTLERLTDGHFELEDKQSHLASMSGCHIEMGPSAVVSHGHITILLTSKPTPPFDLGQWRSQGVDPEKLDVIGVKAAVAHRRAYDTISASSFTVKTPGPCSSDLSLLSYQKIRRPIFPLDS